MNDLLDVPFIGTKRGKQLALCGWPVRPTITIELSGKWYGIWLLTPVDVSSHMYQMEELSFEVLEQHRGDGSYFCDHVPSPHALRRFCKANDYELDEFAEEMIIGRWEQEGEDEGGVRVMGVKTAKSSREEAQRVGVEIRRIASSLAPVIAHEEALPAALALAQLGAEPRLP